MPRCTKWTRTNRLPDLHTLDQIKSGTVASDRLQTMLLTTFATLALLLSAVGIYGVISYSVTQRTHELGIRAALGASQWGLLALVIRPRHGADARGAGVGRAGFAGAHAAAEHLAIRHFAARPGDADRGGRDPSTVAFAACYIPARRAAAIDPTVALRYE